MYGNIGNCVTLAASPESNLRSQVGPASTVAVRSYFSMLLGDWDVDVGYNSFFVAASHFSFTTPYADAPRTSIASATSYK
jgi:hypothetical protein